MPEIFLLRGSQVSLGLKEKGELIPQNQSTASLMRFSKMEQSKGAMEKSGVLGKESNKVSARGNLKNTERKIEKTLKGSESTNSRVKLSPIAIQIPV
jgi:hypothetical protein